MIAEDQPESSGQDVEPFVALVGLGLGRRLVDWDDHLPGLQGSGMLGQRQDGTAVDLARLQAHARVAALGYADEFIEGDAVGCGDGQQQFQARFALPGL